jgi:hypothetical protein
MLISYPTNLATLLSSNSIHITTLLTEVRYKHSHFDKVVFSYILICLATLLV